MWHYARGASAFLTALCLLSGAFSTPLNARDDALTSSGSTSTAPTAALVQTTISGKATAIEVAVPTAITTSSSLEAAGSTASATATTDAASTTSNATAGSTDISEPTNNLFPQCHETSARPFCLPNNNTDVYVGETYYVTWNADFFPRNSLVSILLNYANSSAIQAWSSSAIPNSRAYATVTMESSWLQGYTRNNLTFIAVEQDNATAQTKPYAGPTVRLTHKPAQHYPPPPRTRPPNKLGLLVGLPVSLGFVAVVLFGLYFGMRKHRQIGLGNVMGRRRGYDTGKSRRQRMGLGKNGAIQLQERETMPPAQQFRDEVRADAQAPQIRVNGHAREESLGSLVSVDETRNAFRSEVERQRTGRAL